MALGLSLLPSCPALSLARCRRAGVRLRDGSNLSPARHPLYIQASGLAAIASSSVILRFCLYARFAMWHATADK